MRYTNGTRFVTDAEIRAAHPSTSFPDVITPGHVEDFGYLPVSDIRPAYDSSVETLVARELPEFIGGEWRVGYDKVTLPGAVVSWRIGVGAFYDRFGDQKIPILASSDPVVQALIRDAQVRKYIDLKRTDLPQMLTVLTAKGFAVDVDTILNTPAAPHELP